MTNARIKYLGNMRMECVYPKSGTAVEVTPTKDHGGQEDTFSPVDLCVASLGCCAATVIAGYAAHHDLDVTGMETEVSATMHQGTPLRLGRVEVVFHMPDQAFSAKDKTVIERVAHTCPVHHSLHPDVEQVFTFDWKK